MKQGSTGSAILLTFCLTILSGLARGQAPPGYYDTVDSTNAAALRRTAPILCGSVT